MKLIMITLMIINTVKLTYLTAFTADILFADAADQSGKLLNDEQQAFIDFALLTGLPPTTGVNNGSNRSASHRSPPVVRNQPSPQQKHQSITCGVGGCLVAVTSFQTLRSHLDEHHNRITTAQWLALSDQSNAVAPKTSPASLPSRTNPSDLPTRSAATRGHRNDVPMTDASHDSVNLSGQAARSTGPTGSVVEVNRKRKQPETNSVSPPKSSRRLSTATLIKQNPSDPRRQFNYPNIQTPKIQAVKPPGTAHIIASTSNVVPAASPAIAKADSRRRSPSKRIEPPKIRRRSSTFNKIVGPSNLSSSPNPSNATQQSHSGMIGKDMQMTDSFYISNVIDHVGSSAVPPDGSVVAVANPQPTIQSKSGYTSNTARKRKPLNPDHTGTSAGISPKPISEISSQRRQQSKNVMLPSSSRRLSTLKDNVDPSKVLKRPAHSVSPSHGDNLNDVDMQAIDSFLNASILADFPNFYSELDGGGASKSRQQIDRSQSVALSDPPTQKNIVHSISTPRQTYPDNFLQPAHNANTMGDVNQLVGKRSDTSNVTEYWNAFIQSTGTLGIDNTYGNQPNKVSAPNESDTFTFGPHMNTDLLNTVQPFDSLKEYDDGVQTEDILDLVDQSNVPQYTKANARLFQKSDDQNLLRDGMRTTNSSLDNSVKNYMKIAPKPMTARQNQPSRSQSNIAKHPNLSRRLSTQIKTNNPSLNVGTHPANASEQFNADFSLFTSRPAQPPMTYTSSTTPVGRKELERQIKSVVPPNIMRTSSKLSNTARRNSFVELNRPNINMPVNSDYAQSIAHKSTNFPETFKPNSDKSAPRSAPTVTEKAQPPRQPSNVARPPKAMLHSFQVAVPPLTHSSTVNRGIIINRHHYGRFINYSDVNLAASTPVEETPSENTQHTVEPYDFKIALSAKKVNRTKVCDVKDCNKTFEIVAEFVAHIADQHKDEVTPVTKNALACYKCYNKGIYWIVPPKTSQFIYEKASVLHQQIEHNASSSVSNDTTIVCPFYLEDIKCECQQPLDNIMKSYYRHVSSSPHMRERQQYQIETLSDFVNMRVKDVKFLLDFMSITADNDGKYRCQHYPDSCHQAFDHIDQLDAHYQLAHFSD